MMIKQRSLSLALVACLIITISLTLSMSMSTSMNSMVHATQWLHHYSPEKQHPVHHQQHSFINHPEHDHHQHDHHEQLAHGHLHEHEHGHEHEHEHHEQHHFDEHHPHHHTAHAVLPGVEHADGEEHHHYNPSSNIFTRMFNFHNIHDPRHQDHDHRETSHSLRLAHSHRGHGYHGRIRRRDYVEDCDSHTSCLLHKHCVSFRSERHMIRDSHGMCTCSHDANICRIHGGKRDFECIDIHDHQGVVKLEDGSCGCDSDHCVAEIEKNHIYKHQHGLILRYGLSLACAKLSNELTLHPLDSSTCTCSPETCQLGKTDVNGPRCISMGERREFSRMPNDGHCVCADEYCEESYDGLTGPKCAALQHNPQYIRRPDGKCGCASGHCRKSGKHSHECIAESATLVRSPVHLELFQDYCVCASTQCELRNDWEKGRVCLSLTEHKDLQRFSNGVIPHQGHDQIAELARHGRVHGAHHRAEIDPFMAAECTCKPSKDTCQFGHGFLGQIYCLDVKTSGFSTDENHRCHCPIDRCIPKDHKGSPTCIVGKRARPWDAHCA